LKLNVHNITYPNLIGRSGRVSGTPSQVFRSESRSGSSASGESGETGSRGAVQVDGRRRKEECREGTHDNQAG
jgi:hypothetical protein